MEKPLCVGQSPEAEMQSIPVLDVEAEIQLASNSLLEYSGSNPCAVQAQKMKQLGFERTRKYGWRNSYEVTKAMGAMVINRKRENVPVVIIRPSIVESTCREPFPGWIQGNRMMDPVLLSYGKGVTSGFVGDPKTVLDVVPADMVVSATTAAIAKHGIAAKPELSVYHVASSVANPISMGEILSFKISFLLCLLQ